MFEMEGELDRKQLRLSLSALRLALSPMLSSIIPYRELHSYHLDFLN